MNPVKPISAFTIIVCAIGVFAIYSCKEDSPDDVNTVLSVEDSTATAGMNHELEMMHHTHDSMMNAPHQQQL